MASRDVRCSSWKHDIRGENLAHFGFYINEDILKRQFYKEFHSINSSLATAPCREEKNERDANFGLCKVLSRWHTIVLTHPEEKKKKQTKAWTAIKMCFETAWHWHQVKHWARKAWKIRFWGWVFFSQSNNAFMCWFIGRKWIDASNRNIKS